MEEPEENIPPEFECSICMKLLLEPVSVTCGHTFCRACLEESLGYRGVCAVCRAPVAGVQAVNVLIKNIIAERFPRTNAERYREKHEQLSADEKEADESRRREASGVVGSGNTSPVLPLTRGLPILLPHCRTEVEISRFSDVRMIEHALQGSRRLGVVEGSSGYDENARPFGVCLEIENVDRSNGQMHVRLVGKHRFWVVEPPQVHEDGFELGRCESFFDEPLELTALLLEPPEPESAADGDAATAGNSRTEITVPELARAVLDLLERQLENVGHSGRHAFMVRFGDMPRISSPTGASTSAAMEKLSFWILGAIVCKDEFRNRWLASVDTRGRLEACGNLLDQAGNRCLLNLPGARSWMRPGQSAFSSLALLIAIVVLLIAKSLGVFEERGISYYRQSSDSEQRLINAYNIAQLLR